MGAIKPRGARTMVATPHATASQIGSDAMRQGGNAFDAAVAASAALAVVYPHMTGLGGDAFFLLYDAKEKKLLGLNGSGRSGSSVSIEAYASRGLASIPQRGIESAITVPGMVDAWWETWRGRGKLPWAELLKPAIELAENGFPVSRNLAHWIVRDEPLLAGCPALSRVYVPGGRALREGDRLVQPELARTLRRIAAGGRDAFYKGGGMRDMTDAIAADGGHLTADDFLMHRSEWVTPLTVPYRGFEVAQMPPNSQGFSALIMLNILENVDLGRIPRHSAEFYHLIAETVKQAFRERDRYLTDPDFVDIPLDVLLSKPYAERLYRDIERKTPTASAFRSPPIGQDTAYAAAADTEGNAASFIQSLYFDFGSAYAPGDTGVILQNRGSYFSLDPTHPNALAPRKRSFHTLMPGMVLKGGKPYALVGTQGGEGQPQTSLSVITGLLDYGCMIEEALALPRWVYGRTWGQDSDALKLENRGSEPIAEQLAAWGHKVELVEAWDGLMGQAQGISIGEDGTLRGAADPRGDGSAVGW